jgi:hypothetical protein
MRQNQETRQRGQQVLARLRAAVDRLERTDTALALYEKELKRWQPADSLQRKALLERTDTLRAQTARLLRRLRLPRDTKGIVEDSTVTARVSEALELATSTPDQPAPGRVAQLQWATSRADALLAEIERFYASEVRGYRDALRAAGFELLGG